MKTHKQRGVSSLEFAFSILVLAPLVLGTGVIGINMVKNLQTTQLARDIGHMYARGVNFGKPGNKTIVSNLGQSLGLSTTAGSGKAVVILSSVTYVDDNMCQAVGAAGVGGVHLGSCGNYGYWVFTQRVTIGNASVRGSNYGAPVTGPAPGVTIAADGTISMQDYCKNPGARANFSGINPYAVINGAASGLPSGEMLYIAEAGALGFNMPPFVSNAVSYSWGIF